MQMIKFNAVKYAFKMIYFNKIMIVFFIFSLFSNQAMALVGIINTQTVLSKNQEVIEKAITKKSEGIKKEIDKYKKVLEEGNKILKENLKEVLVVQKLKEIILMDLKSLDRNLKKQIEEKRKK